MTASAVAPIIIKRKKVVGGGGHHGGAWKVAYADFVTAMMAFFMLMWLLNATSENQRQGIADYFSPTIPVVRISGGGANALGGSDIFSDEKSVDGGVGGMTEHEVKGEHPSVSGSGLDVAPLPSELAEIEEALTGVSGESMVSDDLLRHIVTRVTDEGLIVDLFDLPGAPLFEKGTTVPTPLMRDLTSVVGEIFALATNEIAVNGHVRSVPLVMRESPVWPVSASRAQSVRDLVTRVWVDPRRIQRIGGYADREPLQADPMDVRNNRIEIILLRD